MTEQYDSLNEKAKLVDVALKYTGGDMGKAKEMAAGQYMDIIAVKGKFAVSGAETASGLFLAFFNFMEEYISNVSAVMTRSSELFEKVRIFDEWKTLYKDLSAYKEGDDVIDSQNFKYFLIDSFIGYDVFPDVQEKNLEDLTGTITEIIGKSFNTQKVQCQIEFEPTSSLDVYLSGITIDVPGADEAPSSAKDLEVPEEDSRITKIENEAKYIVEGKAMLAPVSGKNVAELVPGEKIKVMLPGKDIVTDKILKVLNAYDDDGNPLPVKGRVKAKIPDEKNGFIVYAFVAKGVLAKIYEEENVKIQLDRPADDDENLDITKIDNRLILLMGIVVGLIILSGIILMQLL